MANIIDLSKEFPDAIKAERKGSNTLILRSICPIRRSDGKRAVMALEYRWHRFGASVSEIQGQEFSYWLKKEIDIKRPLFEQVNLF